MRQCNESAPRVVRTVPLPLRASFTFCMTLVAEVCVGKGAMCSLCTHEEQSLHFGFLVLTRLSYILFQIESQYHLDEFYFQPSNRA